MEMTKETWRLILHPPYDGAWNMAVDEAILESVSSTNEPPTLRLYSWYPYALSLGHVQPISDVDLFELKRKGWSLVRRPTGGRAILHADELTYSVSAPIDNPILKGNVIDSYKRISAALLSALEFIGLKADSKMKNPEDLQLSKDPVCFQYPSDYEITFNGKKIIGSAQARKKNGILQHGSIPLYGDISRIIEVLVLEENRKKESAKQNLNKHASTLQNALGQFVSWSQMADAVIHGFNKELILEFNQSRLSQGEIKRAKEIYSGKYSHDSWTMRI